MNDSAHPHIRNDEIINQTGLGEKVIDAEFKVTRPRRGKKILLAAALTIAAGSIGAGWLALSSGRLGHPLIGDLPAAPMARPPFSVPPQSGKAASPKPTPPAPSNEIAAPSASTSIVNPAMVAPSQDLSTATNPSAQTGQTAPAITAPASATAEGEDTRLAAKVAQLTQAIATLKARMAEGATERSPRRPVAATAAAVLPVHRIDLSAHGVLAITVDSVIVRFHGHDREVFVGQIIPGMNERLGATNPRAHEFATNRATYLAAN
ncbi:MAG: hypothetical protein M0T84_15605 [Betaproteobacteria bacterium]|nr:hypothetical protein [Betaproteobacteria bacterium]